MSDQALSEAVAHFRAGEAETGRSGGKLWSVFATACDVSEERYLKLIVARLATYLQIPGYGEALVNVNGWDMDTLQAFRNAPIVAIMPGAIPRFIAACWFACASIIVAINSATCENSGDSTRYTPAIIVIIIFASWETGGHQVWVGG